MKFRNARKLLRNIKWKFYELNLELIRRKLEKSDFFEDVLCTNGFIIKDNMYRSIARWIFDLKKYKQIEIKKFKDLFKVADEVVFPIQIKYSSRGTIKIDIDIIDSNGEEYYFYSNGLNDYYKMTEYWIGKRNSLLEPLVDKTYNFRICGDGTIELLKKMVLKLKQDGSNSDTMYEFYYNHNTNTEVVTVYSKENKLTIECPIGYEIDKDVTKYFDKWCYYDVFPVLKSMVSKITGDDISIHIVAEINDEVFSEVEVVNSIVQKYTFTKVLNEGEIHVIKKIFSRELEEFLLNNN